MISECTSPKWRRKGCLSRYEAGDSTENILQSMVSWLYLYVPFRLQQRCLQLGYHTDLAMRDLPRIGVIILVLESYIFVSNSAVTANRHPVRTSLQLDSSGTTCHLFLLSLSSLKSVLLQCGARRLPPPPPNKPTNKKKPTSRGMTRLSRAWKIKHVKRKEEQEERRVQRIGEEPDSA